MSEKYMNIALDEARLAALEGEVPIGACVVYEDRVISRAHNRRESNKSPSAHAEFLAMQQASEVLGRWRLTGCEVYVTLEPCCMCAGMMVNSRVDRCVYGAKDPKGGALGSLYDLSVDKRLNHEFEVVPGIMEEECASVLKEFFAARRKCNKERKRAGIAAPVAEKIDELECCRRQIDVIDARLLELYTERMDVVSRIAAYKQEHELPVFDDVREQEKISTVLEKVEERLRPYVAESLQNLMDQSKLYQQSKLKEEHL